MKFMHAKLDRLSPKIDEDRSNMSSASDVVVMSQAHRMRENEGRWRTDLDVAGSSREDGRVVLWDVVTQTSSRTRV